MVRGWERAAGCALLVCSAWVYGACEPAGPPPTPRAEDAWSPPAAPASATAQLPTQPPSFLRARTVPAACEATLDAKGRLKVKEELGGLAVVDARLLQTAHFGVHASARLYLCIAYS